MVEHLPAYARPWLQPSITKNKNKLSEKEKTEHLSCSRLPWVAQRLTLQHLAHCGKRLRAETIPWAIQSGSVRHLKEQLYWNYPEDTRKFHMRLSNELYFKTTACLEEWWVGTGQVAQCLGTLVALQRTRFQHPHETQLWNSNSTGSHAVLCPPWATTARHMVHTYMQAKLFTQ